MTAASIPQASRVRSSQPALQGVTPYDPKYIPAEIYLSANENPQTLPDVVMDEVYAQLRRASLNRYPDPLANELRDLIAAHYGLTRDNVLVGNAGDELLFDLALAWGGPNRTLLNCPPTFSVYGANAHLTDTRVIDVARKDDFSLDEEAVIARAAQGDVDMVVITSPNNPTGNADPLEFIKRLLEATDALVLVDEAYGEFGTTPATPLLADHENLVILHTFSKAYSAAGVRLGYVLAQPTVIQELLKVRQPYSVDSISQIVGCAIMRNTDVFADRIAAIIAERERMAQCLAEIPGITVYPSQANFLLVRIPGADAVWQGLYDRGILVRDFSHAPGLENCLRITIGSKEENDAVLAALEELLS